ncbi:hypothetical protein Bca52824_033952 [Brassica carinata]|uniref:Uncharacterized protein n=1 Tax=Brassica carinata TaxID=52824 RepID=A0A8X7V9R3_BRACI|nr:hypothetical protein Bca52824_033952 [Brassica carinata]
MNVFMFFVALCSVEAQRRKRQTQWRRRGFRHLNEEQIFFPFEDRVWIRVGAFKENVRPLKRGHNVCLLNHALDIQRKLIEDIDEYGGPWIQRTTVTLKKMLETAFPVLDVILKNYPQPALESLLPKVAPVAQMRITVLIVGACMVMKTDCRIGSENKKYRHVGIPNKNHINTIGPGLCRTLKNTYPCIA